MDEPAESYVVRNKVDGRFRYYCGAAKLSRGGAEARLHKIKMGKAAAFLRPKGPFDAEQAASAEIVYRRAFPTFRQALVDEATQVGERYGRFLRVRGAHVASVTVPPGGFESLKNLAQAASAATVDGRWAAVVTLANSDEKLEDHLEDRCYSCHTAGHYAAKCTAGDDPPPPPPPKAGRRHAEHKATKGLRVRWDGSQHRWQFHRANNSRGAYVLVEVDAGWEVKKTRGGIALSLWAGFAEAREAARLLAEGQARGSRQYD